MRLLGILFFCFMFSVNQVLAQNKFWTEVSFRYQDKITPVVNGLIWQDSKIGFFTYFLVKEKYAQAYFGPRFRLSDHLSLGLGVGLEQSKKPFVFGATLFAKHKRNSVLFIGKKGQTYFYRLEYKYRLSKLSVGILAQKRIGIGPRIEFNLAKLRIWVVKPVKKRSFLIGFRWLSF